MTTKKSKQTTKTKSAQIRATKINTTKRKGTQKESSGSAQSFFGISLGGGKSDRTAYCRLDWYKSQRRLVISELVDKFTGSDGLSSDQLLVDVILKENKSSVFALDVPLVMPKCISCELRCPGYDFCQEPHITWMRKKIDELNLKLKPPRQFTPYTERSIELYLRTELEEPFVLQQSLGANMAPLTARSHFITKRVKARRKDILFIECFPKLTLWRMGNAWSLQKSHLRFHKHSVTGEESRAYLLKQFSQKMNLFVYQLDQQNLVASQGAFDAFLCALTAFFYSRGLCEPKPKGFPDDGWVCFPKREIPTKDLF